MRLITSVVRTPSPHIPLLDQYYMKLGCQIEPIEKHTDDFLRIDQFIANNCEPSVKPAELVQLYRVIGHADDFARYHTFASRLGNRKLLWHPVHMSEVVGVLAQGLFEPTAESPACAYRFGKGIYFFDVLSQAIRKCIVGAFAQQPTDCVLLLCDVALGKQYECARDLSAGMCNYLCVNLG